MYVRIRSHFGSAEQILNQKSLQGYGTGLEIFLILFNNLCNNITAMKQVIAGYIYDGFQLENQSLS